MWLQLRQVAYVPVHAHRLHEDNQFYRLTNHGMLNGNRVL